MDVKGFKVDISNFSTNEIVKAFESTADNYRKFLIKSRETNNSKTAGMIFIDDGKGIKVSQFGTLPKILNCLIGLTISSCNDVGADKTVLLLCQAGKLIETALQAGNFNKKSNTVISTMIAQLREMLIKNADEDNPNERTAD